MLAIMTEDSFLLIFLSNIVFLFTNTMLLPVLRIYNHLLSFSGLCGFVVVVLVFAGFVLVETRPMYSLGYPETHSV